MDQNLLFGLLLILPCAGGAICTMLPTPRRILATMCATIIACAAIMIPMVRRVIAIGPVEAFGGLFFVDALSAYHLCVMSIVFVASSIYAWPYFIREVNSGHVAIRSLHQYAGLWCGALAAMTLVLISNNLGIMWVGI